MDWVGRKYSSWRSVALTLTAFALALRVLIPAGFMVDTRQGAPAGLVICTGHGPLIIDGKGDPKAPAKKGGDPLCPFAGFGASPLSAPLSVGPAEPLSVAVDAALGALAADLAPGRGLAAPPPQSHAPPASLT